MSLPIVWWSAFHPRLKWGIAFLLWCAVVLTFSRGALAAIPVAVAAGVVLASSRETKWRSAAALLALGVGSYAILLPVNPYWIEWLYGPGVHNPIAAEYRTPWNNLRQQPGSVDEIPVETRNIGITKWRARGLWHSAIAYRWWNISSETF